MSVGSAPTILAVIPARGGSKGIKRKNLLRLGGRTLVARTIAAARAARYDLDVVVSTDDPEIREEATRHGARVIVRPDILATDGASSEDVLLHALDADQENGRELPELLVLLQCTSPFTEAPDIDGTISALLQASADSSFSAVASHLFLWKADESGTMIGVNHDHRVRLRRQDSQPHFVETGAVYVMRTEGFVAHKHRFFGRVVAHETPAANWIEIDEPADVVVAEARLAASASPKKTALSGRVSGVVFDFDGVMTDDRVILNEDGVESVRCSRGYGYGIEQIRQAGLHVSVLSREVNPVVQVRCEKLKIECLQGIRDKATSLREWAVQKAIPLSEIVYVGNDLPDIPCLEMVGFGVAVADAHPKVRAMADLVLERRGGDGAVREICELISLFSENRLEVV